MRLATFIPNSDIYSLVSYWINYYNHICSCPSKFLSQEEIALKLKSSTNYWVQYLSFVHYSLLHNTLSSAALWTILCAENKKISHRPKKNLQYMEVNVRESEVELFCIDKLLIYTPRTTVLILNTTKDKEKCLNRKINFGRSNTPWPNYDYDDIFLNFIFEIIGSLIYHCEQIATRSDNSNSDDVSEDVDAEIQQQVKRFQLLFYKKLHQTLFPDLVTSLKKMSPKAAGRGM